MVCTGRSGAQLKKERISLSADIKEVPCIELEEGWAPVAVSSIRNVCMQKL